MDSQAYWNERAVLLSESLLDQGDVFYERLTREYERVITQIEKETAVFYQRFAKDNKVTYVQAKQLLTSDERRRFQLELGDYINRAQTLPYSPGWAAALENASNVHRVTRLEYLNLQMRQQVEELYSKYDSGMKQTARDVFTEGYYRSLYEADKAAGYGAPFATLDTETVKTVINRPWAPDGSNFSEKIWKDREGLVNYLHTELAQAFIRGESADRLIKDIKKRFAKKFDDPATRLEASKEAARLVQTEMAYFSAMAKLQSYKTLGYKKYIIVAVMDGKTSTICCNMNNEVFDIEDFKPGITANPFHPRCRTTTAPYLEKGGEAAGPGMGRNPQTGKLEPIPQDMSYQEWYDRFVEDGSAEGNQDTADDPLVNSRIDTDAITLGAGSNDTDIVTPETSGNDTSSVTQRTDSTNDSGLPEDESVFIEHIDRDEVDKKLAEYENGIKDNDYETAYVITETGDVYKQTGDGDSVYINDTLPLLNAIITHNHPFRSTFGDDSFSDEDYRFLQLHQEINEFRVISPNHLYRLKILKQLDIPYNEVYIQGLDRAYRAKASNEIKHHSMLYLRERGYVDYTREDFDG